MITDILLEPVGRSFDVTEVHAYLLAQPHVARDSHELRKFMVAEDDDELADARAARERDRVRVPMDVILIEVGPERIDVSFRKSRVEAARRFVAWLRDRYRLRIMDEELNDLSAYCTDDLDFLFGAASEPDEGRGHGAERR